MITLFQKSWSTVEQQFSPLQLHWHLPFQLPSLVSKVPRLLPSSQQVRAKWNEIYAAVVKPKIFSVGKIKVVEWLIPDIIEYICGNIVLMALITVPVDTLEVILKLDAFPVAGGSCLLMSLTLGNFGLLCKTSCLHFIVAIADCNDHERDIVAQVLANNFAIIDQLAATGIIWVQALQRHLNIVFHFGGDDKILCLITGLEVSSSNWCCFYCFWMRNMAFGVAQCPLKRCTHTAVIFAEKQECGHECVPLLKNILWTAYKMCVLHALMSMGRLLCQWLHDWLAWTETQTGSASCWNVAQYWLKSLKINIDISKPPLNKSWNCKGNVSFNVYIVYLNII